MVVISEPAKELVGGGKNAKYVKECKELSLGNRSIDKIRGFEPFVNLESLWLNGNRLKKINNLDANFRIKVLCVQDNQICTLKGSLPCFKFLEQLDLSNNHLRDLDKMLDTLDRFQFLTHLNLKGNPCCEEPDYRLRVIHRMPRLKVLDMHVVTPLEKTKAAGVIGGDVQTLTVAFGKRAPLRQPEWDDKVQERSVLEQELVKEAARVRDVKIVRAADAELAQFAHNPYPDIPRGRSLPPNAGTSRAMAMWQTQQLGSTAGSSGGLEHTWPAGASGTGEMPWSTSKPRSADAASDSPYRPKDVLVLYQTDVRRDLDLLQSGTTLSNRPPSGSIRFERSKYEQFVARKTAGTQGNWEVRRNTVHI
mmetsp:Transcript_18694/g.40191  ORF Transcript_18694/g.40191 Transcript_18694/m.40191 type:complete len:364 (+) Transcript_18694:241-1332(+)|eukprot:CAMPEP_0202914864 /NCGR_PEP_ID=MMETSP1392-20130828/64222_1 /ASSEMBLY_ACC=CAM_ASM_000868 /TAXON_ID=225041 /ORGANISM="Chlamydomonas chlamydogama, Strain SAG 11-48b" /LENGTH=363 /DNA_ID=CAMNT_0049606687 /DNA_START=165 /DNA_END=1256 /DNA_ORIENTATION=+